MFNRTDSERFSQEEMDTPSQCEETLNLLPKERYLDFLFGLDSKQYEPALIAQLIVEKNIEFDYLNASIRKPIQLLLILSVLKNLQEKQRLEFAIKFLPIFPINMLLELFSKDRQVECLAIFFETKQEGKSLDLANFMSKLPEEDRFGVACRFISHVDDQYYYEDDHDLGYGSALLIQELPEEHRCEYALKIINKIGMGLKFVFNLIPQNHHPKFLIKVHEISHAKFLQLRKTRHSSPSKVVASSHEGITAEQRFAKIQELTSSLFKKETEVSVNFYIDFLKKNPKNWETFIDVIQTAPASYRYDIACSEYHDLIKQPSQCEEVLNLLPKERCVDFLFDDMWQYSVLTRRYAGLTHIANLILRYNLESDYLNAFLEKSTTPLLKMLLILDQLPEGKRFEQALKLLDKIAVNNLLELFHGDRQIEYNVALFKKRRNTSLDIVHLIKTIPSEYRFVIACRFISHVDDNYYVYARGYGSELIIQELPEAYRCEYALKIVDKIKEGFQFVVDLIPENDRPKFTAKVTEIRCLDRTSQGEVIALSTEGITPEQQLPEIQELKVLLSAIETEVPLDFYIGFLKSNPQSWQIFFGVIQIAPAKYRYDIVRSEFKKLIKKPSPSQCEEMLDFLPKERYLDFLFGLHRKQYESPLIAKLIVEKNIEFDYLNASIREPIQPLLILSVLKNLQEKQRLEFAIKFLPIFPINMLLELFSKDRQIECLAIFFETKPEGKSLDLANFMSKLPEKDRFDVACRFISHVDDQYYYDDYRQALGYGAGLLIKELPFKYRCEYALKIIDKINKGLPFVLELIPENDRPKFVAKLSEREPLENQEFKKSLSKKIDTEVSVDFYIDFLKKNPKSWEIFVEVIQKAPVSYRYDIACSAKDLIQTSMQCAVLLNYLPKERYLDFVFGAHWCCESPPIAKLIVEKNLAFDYLQAYLKEFILPHLMLLILKELQEEQRLEFAIKLLDKLSVTVLLELFPKERQIEYMATFFEKEKDRKSLALANFIRKLPNEDRISVANRFISHIDDDYYTNIERFGSELIIQELPEEHRYEYALKIKDKIKGGLEFVIDLIPEKDRMNFREKTLSNKIFPVSQIGLFSEIVDENKKQPVVSDDNQYNIN
jgi:hypothetical protein